jgi:hypothetical protein
MGWGGCTDGDGVHPVDLATGRSPSRVTTTIRATTHSFLAQVEYLGEIVCGLTIAAIARLTSLPLALVGCAALFAVTVVTMWRPVDRGHGRTGVDA